MIPFVCVNRVPVSPVCVPGQYLNPMDSRYYTYNEATRGYESFVPPPPEGDPPEPAPGYSMQFVSLPLTHDQQAKADKVREGGWWCVCTLALSTAGPPVPKHPHADTLCQSSQQSLAVNLGCMHGARSVVAYARRADVSLRCPRCMCWLVQKAAKALAKQTAFADVPPPIAAATADYGDQVCTACMSLLLGCSQYLPVGSPACGVMSSGEGVVGDT